MIPAIETIIEELLAGNVTKSQVITWLHMHAEDAGRELRDDFAGQALAGLIGGALAEGLDYPNYENAATYAYAYADSMLAHRAKGTADD
jgi:hypothetical protein